MRSNNLLYLIKEGIKSIFVHGFMSFAAVCVTVACLLIVGMFASVMYNVNIMVDDLNRTNEILVYIDEELTESEAKSVGTDINMLDNVLNTQFITREQALEDFIAEHQGDAAFDGLTADNLRHRYVIVLEDNGLMRQTVEQLEKISGVAEIVAYYKVAEGFSMIQDVLQVVYVVALAVLLVISLLICGGAGCAAGDQLADHFQHGPHLHVWPQGGNRHHENGGCHRWIYPSSLCGAGLPAGHDRRGHRLRGRMVGL